MLSLHNCDDIEARHMPGFDVLGMWVRVPGLPRATHYEVTRVLLPSVAITTRFRPVFLAW
jgi:hypothetical protein